QEEVVETYDINDYKEKTELTSARLFTVVTAALRGYRELKRRRAAESALQTLNEELEERVELRTRELRNANQHLREEMDERKRLQAQLIHSERMATAGTLAAGVSHEFNNINVSVLGWADIGLAQEGLSPELVKCLEKIRAGVMRAKDITMNMIAFTAEGSAEGQEVVLQELVSQALNDLKPEFDKGIIKVKTNYGGSLHCLVSPVQFLQVLRAVIGNAVHAMLTAKTRTLTLSTQVEGNQALLSIADTGCGIPTNAQEKVTLPFFSLKGEKVSGHTPLSGVKGIGLGLSVAHTIMKNFGGDLTLKSEEGQGTMVHLKLPLACPLAEEPQEGASDSAASDQALDILVLEDEIEVAQLITYVLQAQGYRVMSTASGREALATMHSRPVKAVLCDIQMPEMSGLEFIHEVEKMDLHPKPISIAITGKVLTAMDREEIEHSFWRMLDKPFQINDLKHCLKEAMERTA
ncbi:MAG: hybrid sensor histidine kinase/response regulator, partial [Planctomycetota bacterium]